MADIRRGADAENLTAACCRTTPPKLLTLFCDLPRGALSRLLADVSQKRRLYIFHSSIVICKVVKDLIFASCYPSEIDT